MIEAAPFHELADEDALVDQVNRLAIRHETTTLQLGFPGVDDPRIEAAGAKIVHPQHELVVGRHFAPIENRHARRRAALPAPAPAPLRVCFEQRMQHAVPRRERAHVEPAQERPHDREREKRFRQRIAVRRPGGRLGVVLGQVHHVLFRQIERIDAGRRARIGEAGVSFHQGLLPIDEPELPAQRSVRERGVIGAVERPQQDRAALL